MITDKMKEFLTESDLQVLESAIDQKIAEGVKVKLDESVNERVTLIEEELKKKYEKIADKYVTEEVEKRVTEEKAKLVESYDEKLDNLETKVVSKLDAFFEQVISEQISDSVIEKLAINEALQPIVEGIKKVYVENFVELGSDSSKKLAEKDEQIVKLQKQVSESIEKLMESEKRLEQTATYLLISEKTEGMLDSEKKRVLTMFKDKSFKEVEGKIDTFVTIIKESAKPIAGKKIVEKKKILDESIDHNDHVDAKKFEKKKVTKVIKENAESMEDKFVDITDIANNFI